MAQEKSDSTLYRVETKDGNEYIGYIISQDGQFLVLATEKLGTITLQKTDIKNIREIRADRLKAGQLWFDNPQATRYFWQPNGYGLERGESYYQNVWIFFNQMAFGMTDNFSIGGGIMPLFLLGGLPTPVWLNPKISVPISENQFNVGAGALMGTVIGNNSGIESPGYGIVYGITTFGSRDKNISFGMGYGYAGGDWANSPTLTISGMLRTGPRGYLLTENYFISTAGSNVALFSFGGRRIIKSSGIDFGLIMPSTNGGSFIAIPWLGFTVPMSAPNK